ncbi:ABC transporter ATP-binding protein [Pusillimonas caeni]|uniref:ABC transporter ATP-binding protein n=1 Tax=Pusillimonas caeni TaxID=1348472 RepID=UPI000E59D910|nr:ABC transporter ATP-binding protein [Pusillimonas caeni]TFL14781.1 ABC transporter ATP-binding protein [Pusillimonas caeni]
MKITIKNLDKAFMTPQGGRIDVLKHIDLDVADGEFLCIVGPSGCGKSTLLRIMADLETYTSGHIEIHHTDSARALTSMVFQEHALFPWMTVLENAGFGLEMAGLPCAQRNELVRSFLHKVGLADFEDYYPAQLSGGMRQRVSLVRAFVNNPEVLLMDEPFAALDAQNKIMLQRELVQIWEANRKSVVYITHSIDEALFLGDRIAVMGSAPGRIVEIIDVPFPRPRDIFGVQSEPRHGELAHHIWGMLEADIRNAHQARG